MSKKIFTDQSVLEMKSCAEGYYICMDCNTRGLGVRVAQSGSVVYISEATVRSTGQRCRITLGPVGELSLDEAREKNYKIRREANRGRDPRSVQPANLMTVDVWVESYLNSCAKRERSPQKKASALRQFASKFIGVPLDNVTALEVQEEMDSQVDRIRVSTINPDAYTGHATANLLKVYVGALYNQAIKLGLAKTNPARHLERFPERGARDVVIYDEERKAIFHILEKGPLEIGRLFRLYFETGMRKREVLKAKWRDLNLEGRVLRIPAENSKSLKPREVPLSTTACRVLAEQRAARATGAPGDPIFPASTCGALHRRDVHRQWKAICAAACVRDIITIHDIRRTVGLRVARRDGILAASRLLGHSSVDVTARVYAPFDLEDHQRFVRDLW